METECEIWEGTRFHTSISLGSRQLCRPCRNKGPDPQAATYVAVAVWPLPDSVGHGSLSLISLPESEVFCLQWHLGEGKQAAFHAFLQQLPAPPESLPTRPSQSMQTEGILGQAFKTA